MLFSSEPRQWRGIAHNMGWSAFDRGDLEKSLRICSRTRSRRARAGQGGRDSSLVGASRARCASSAVSDEAHGHPLDVADATPRVRHVDAYVDEELAACRAALDENDATAGEGPSST